MVEQTELYLFYVVYGVYLASWALYLTGRSTTSLNQVNAATVTLTVGCALHVALIALRFYRTGNIPIISAYEFVSAFAFFVIAIFLLFSIAEKNRALGLFLVPVALCLMTYAIFLSRRVVPEIPIFQSVMLKLHVTTALIAYSSWAVTFAASSYYLYLGRVKQERSVLMDQVAYKSAFIAFCFLTVCIITGSLWADEVWGQLWFWDPKETWSLITWFIFLAYLHSRYTLKWEGTRASLLAIAGFASVVFTYVGVDFFLPQIHAMGMTTLVK